MVIRRSRPPVNYPNNTLISIVLHHKRSYFPNTIYKTKSQTQQKNQIHLHHSQRYTPKYSSILPLRVSLSKTKVGELHPITSFLHNNLHHTDKQPRSPSATIQQRSPSEHSPKDSSLLKTAATYSPTGVQYHRRGRA